jgi:hypothetical protein
MARDIDVTTICPSLELDLVLELGRALARQPRVRRLSFRNDTGAWNVDPAYPDGLYWMVDYRTAAGADWNLDLWFLAEGTTQFDLEHLKTMPQQLRPHTRLAILRIKEACQGRTPRVRSQRIYEAVLDHGIGRPTHSRATWPNTRSARSRWAGCSGRNKNARRNHSLGAPSPPMQAPAFSKSRSVGPSGQDLLYPALPRRRYGLIHEF